MFKELPVNFEYDPKTDTYKLVARAENSTSASKLMMKTLEKEPMANGEIRA